MTESDSNEQATLRREAMAFRRLVQHLQERTDVQNVDLMKLAGFCRNCLSRWLQEESDGALTKDEARLRVYGMDYGVWKERYHRDVGKVDIAKKNGSQ